ncbi:PAS domain S-box protein [Calothrix sp. NIES-2098]|uniref:PAS domain S-box protein n=1 Tax=Calothrix sp. NIES-2098 TaxID=1954171 RepID=UPI000B6128F3|nr:multi-sensor hybrid histidine kinase [Calothrix sp. NIES-2098]
MRFWFRHPNLSSLRTRLVLLVLLAVIPSLGLILYTAAVQRRSAALDAQENLLRMVKLAAANQRQASEGARQLLIALSQMPEIREGNVGECNRLLANLLQQYHSYAGLGVVDASGNLICSIPLATKPVNTADRAYFRLAKETRNFAIGEYEIGRVTSKATLNFGYPILDKSGQVQAVVIAALDLAWLNRLVAELKLPAGSVVTITDRQGTVLVRYPDAQNLVGKSVPDAAITKLVLSQIEGTTEAMGLDGVKRLYAFTTLGSSAVNRDIHVRVGMSRTVAFAAANRLLLENLIGLGCVTALAIAAAWVGGDVFLTRKVKSLVQTTQQLQAGDLSARTEFSQESGEIGQLARAFDDMAAAIATREQAIAALNQDLQTLFEVIPIGLLLATDPEFKQIKSNPTFAQILGLAADANVSYTPENAPPPAYKIFKDGRELAPEEFPLRSAAIHKTEIKGTEVDIDRGDGRVFNLFGYAKPLLDEQGRLRGSVAAFLDITERKRTEETLRRTNQTLQTLIEACPVAIACFDPQGIVTLWNRAAEQIFGWSAEEAIGQFMPTVPHRQQEFLASLQTVLSGRSLHGFEVQHQAKDGRMVDLEIWANLTYDAQGNPGCLGIAWDITARKRSEAALRQSEAKYQVLVSNMPGMVYRYVPFANGTAAFTYVSSGSLELLELEPQTILQDANSFLKLIHPDDLPAFECSVAIAVENSSFWQWEGRIITPSGQLKWIQGRSRPEPTEYGLAWDGLLFDITQRKQAEAEREQLLWREQAAREQAEAANRIKDEFLAVLSHELRSPLNPILGWTQMLQKGKLDPQTSFRALESIERNAKLQTQLIEDLLDVSRILRGKMVLNIMPVNLVTVIESGLETVRLAAEAKQIQIQTFVNREKLQVSGDPARLQQIIWNLLSNAVKFTPDGAEIAISLEQISSYAQISVQDSGQGINPEFLPYVFDYFRQENSKTTRRFGGLGLGLAIVRHLTELHGGTVEAASPGEGQGATFTVRLPLITVTAASVPEKATAVQSVDFSQLRILVVDDEADMRDLVKVILEQQGAQVTVATNATEVLMLCDRQPPDILISDIGMPDIDGYMLMQQIRARSPQQGGNIKAIALSAYAAEYDQKQALKVGFQKHIPKPVEPEVLVNTISELIISG